jgi:hypothetical protein
MQYERMTSYGKKSNNNERPEKLDLTFSTTTASFGEPSEIHLVMAIE